MGRTISIFDCAQFETTGGGNKESHLAAMPSSDRFSHEETRATALSAVPILTGILPQRKGLFMRGSTYLALCVAVVVPLMALKAANAPGIHMLGWSSLADRIRARSSVVVGDNFRQDLRHWAGKEGWSDSWTFNGGGFVVPGQLAIDIQSVPLANYRMEFAGKVERNGLGFAYRAMDFDNYYAGRIVMVNGDSTSEAVLERYAVIDGQAGPANQVRLPFAVRADTTFNVTVEAKGDHFVTRINNQVIDTFSDSRLPRGGAGFFGSPGESARIYGFHLYSYNDVMGKVCSLLAPLS